MSHSNEARHSVRLEAASLNPTQFAEEVSELKSEKASFARHISLAPFCGLEKEYMNAKLKMCHVQIGTGWLKDNIEINTCENLNRFPVYIQLQSLPILKEKKIQEVLQTNVNR